MGSISQIRCNISASDESRLRFHLFSCLGSHFVSVLTPTEKLFKQSTTEDEWLQRNRLNIVRYGNLIITSGDFALSHAVIESEYLYHSTNLNTNWKWIHLLFTWTPKMYAAFIAFSPHSLFLWRLWRSIECSIELEDWDYLKEWVINSDCHMVTWLDVVNRYQLV